MKEQCHFKRCTKGNFSNKHNLHTPVKKKTPKDQNNDSCLKVVKKIPFQGV